MKELQGFSFAGIPCEIVLAKPQMDKKKKAQIQAERARRQEPQMLHGAGWVFLKFFEIILCVIRFGPEIGGWKDVNIRRTEFKWRVEREQGYWQKRQDFGRKTEKKF